MQDDKAFLDRRVQMTEAKIKTRKFRIIGWRKPKLLEDMTVPELMTMRNRAYMLAMSYGGNDRVSAYWLRVEGICKALIDGWDNGKKLDEYERKKSLEARA